MLYYSLVNIRTFISDNRRLILIGILISPHVCMIFQIPCNNRKVRISLQSDRQTIFWKDVDDIQSEYTFLNMSAQPNSLKQ